MTSMSIVYLLIITYRVKSFTYQSVYSQGFRFSRTFPCSQWLTLNQNIVGSINHSSKKRRKRFVKGHFLKTVPIIG